MKKLKNILLLLVMLVSVCGVIYGIGWIKYKIWRAEHPHAKTWTFFIPNGR